jgi:hypothetical protein
MQLDGKRLKKKELPEKLLWNEELAANCPSEAVCEEKAIAQT